MLTGPRGKIFLSYRWSGPDFEKIAAWTALQLVRRGYEVVFDKFIVDAHKHASGEEFTSTLIREMASANLFVALITPDYLSVMYGTPVQHEWALPNTHVIRNDGVVRDELKIANFNLNNALGPFEGLGLTYGCKFAGTAEFMFPIFDMGTSNTDAAKVLDAQFETPLDLPDTVVVEVKFEDGWYRWPSGVILPLAYMIARRIILDKINVKYDFYHHREYIPLWSRIDRRHIVYERRAMSDPTPGISGQDVIYVCENCTAQYELSLGLEFVEQCIRCRRGKCHQRLRHKVEALVVLAPDA